MVNPKFPWLYNLNNPVGGLKVSLRSTYMDPLSDFRKKNPTGFQHQPCRVVFFGFSEPLCAGTIDGFPSSARSPKWSPWLMSLFIAFRRMFQKNTAKFKRKAKQKLKWPKKLTVTIFSMSSNFQHVCANPKFRLKNNNNLVDQMMGWGHKNEMSFVLGV